MASAESAVIAAVKSDGAVAALARDRVFVFGARQGVKYPYVTVQRISTPTAAHLNGPATLQWPRLQLDVWAETAQEAIDLSEAVRGAIDSIETSGDGLTFTATFQDQDGPAPDEETRKFRVSQDYMIWHERT